MASLPNKYVTVEYSIIGVAALVMEALRPNDTISSLWDRVSVDQRVRTFDRFAEAATLAYTAGLLDIEDGVLSVGRSEASS